MIAERFGGVVENFDTFGFFWVNGEKFHYDFNENTPGNWTFFFKAHHKGSTTIEPTGSLKSAAVKVFSHIIKLVETFLVKCEPDTLMFSGEKTSNHAKLYTAMSRVMKPRLEDLGYFLEIEESRDRLKFFIDR